LHCTDLGHDCVPAQSEIASLSRSLPRAVLAGEQYHHPPMGFNSVEGERAARDPHGIADVQSAIIDEPLPLSCDAPWLYLSL
jgi:hypothetical protein